MPKVGWINYKNHLLVAACVAINEDGEVLAVKRNLEPGRNKWALPGGFVESEEEPEKQPCVNLKKKQK